MAKIFVKPAIPNLLIRFPENNKQILSEQGEWVEENREWIRKINFGDVVIATPTDNEPKKSKGKTFNETQPLGESK